MTDDVWVAFNLGALSMWVLFGLVWVFMKPRFTEAFRREVLKDEEPE